MSKMIHYQDALHDIDSLLMPLETHTVLVQVFNIFAKAHEKELASYGLSISQWVTLWSLYVFKKPTNATEISRLLPIEAPSISLLLERLQDRKLIRRRRSRTDKRIWDITLTEQGRQLVYSVYPQIARFIFSIYGGISTDDMAELNRILLRIRDNMVDIFKLNRTHVDQGSQPFFSLIKDLISDLPGKEVESLAKYVFGNQGPVKFETTTTGKVWNIPG